MNISKEWNCVSVPEGKDTALLPHLPMGGSSSRRGRKCIAGMTHERITLHPDMPAKPQVVKATKISVRRVFLKARVSSQPHETLSSARTVWKTSLMLLAGNCHHLPHTGGNKHNPLSLKVFSSRRNGGRNQGSLLQIPSINDQVAWLLPRSIHSLHLDVTAHLSSERDCMLFTYAETGALVHQDFSGLQWHKQTGSHSDVSCSDTDSCLVPPLTPHQPICREMSSFLPPSSQRQSPKTEHVSPDPQQQRTKLLTLPPAIILCKRPYSVGPQNSLPKWTKVPGVLWLY